MEEKLTKNQEKYQSTLCAKCSCKTTANTKRANIKRVSAQWMREVIQIFNKFATNQNEYVCFECYKSLYSYINKEQDYIEHLETASQVYEECQELKKHDSQKTCELDFEKLTDRRCHALTGLNIDQFNDLCSYFKNFLPPVKLSLKTCIGIYMMKLRLGLSCEELGALYVTTNRDQVLKIVIYCRNLVDSYFTPLNLGCKAISRDEILNLHKTKMAQILLSAAPYSVLSITLGVYQPK